MNQPEGASYNASMEIRTEDLCIGFGKKGLEEKRIASGINVHLKKGQLVCLTGPNGSGKSTLIRTLAGFHKKVSGNIIINGREGADIAPKDLARIIGIVLTEKHEAEGMTVHDLVALGRHPYTNWLGTLQEEDERIVAECLMKTGLGAFGSRNLNELSDGERQKAMIARALAQKTDYILLDEPTSFLDFPSKVETMELLRSISHKENIGILFSSHDMELAFQVAGKVWLMGNGKLHCGLPEDMMLSGVFEKVFNKPGTSFNMSTGKFKPDHISPKVIGLAGPKIGAFWTGKALEREGYVPVVGKYDNYIEVIEENNVYSWKWFKDLHLCHEGKTIEEVIQILRNTNAQ